MLPQLPLGVPPATERALDRKGRIAGVDAVLCLTPAGHGRSRRIRPQGHRARPQCRGAAIHRRRGLRRRESLRALHKVSEIYDRIAFAAVGKYNEFENLRIGGVRYADLRGYTYDREDVTARGLVNVYAQTLGTIFSSAAEKPYEVELIVAEVGAAPEDDQIYRLPHDGSIVDEHGSVAVGGNADQISSYLDQRHRDGMTLAEALKLAVESLSRDTNGGERTLTARTARGRHSGPHAAAAAQVQADPRAAAVAAPGRAHRRGRQGAGGGRARRRRRRGRASDEGSGGKGSQGQGRLRGGVRPAALTRYRFRAPGPVQTLRPVTARRGARHVRGRPGAGRWSRGRPVPRGAWGRLAGRPSSTAIRARIPGLAELLGGQPYGRQLRFDGYGQGQVVEAGDGDVFGDAQPQAADGLAGARGDDVVVAEQRRGAGAGPGEGGGRRATRRRRARAAGCRAQQSAGDALEAVGDRRGRARSKVQDRTSAARWVMRRWPRARQMAGQPAVRRRRYRG